jgi:broad specificity phosphatase PhoE
VTCLLLIRHGETDWLGKRLAGRLPDVHLNAEGRAKAETLAAALRDLPITEIYSSPLERALETAEPAARLLGKKILQDDGLQEVDFGALAGKTFDELRNLDIWRTVHRNPAEVHYPGGEGLTDVQERAVRTIRSIHRKEPRAMVALFTHADTIRLAVAHFLSMPLIAYHALIVDPGSISVVCLTPEGVRVAGFNLPAGSPLKMKAE